MLNRTGGLQLADIDRYAEGFCDVSNVPVLRARLIGSPNKLIERAFSLRVDNDPEDCNSNESSLPA